MIQQAESTTLLGAFTYRYTGKERDTESGLDYFGARYYGSSMGRFSSPDDGSDWNPSEPQSWNLYSYVRNNPLKYTDLTGHDCVYLNNAGNAAEEVDQHSSQAECSGDGTSKNPGTGGYWVDGHADTLYTDPNSNTVGLTGFGQNGMQTSSLYNSGDSASVSATTDSAQIVSTQLSGFYTLPQNAHFQFKAEIGYSPWQMVKRMFNCWVADDPDRHIAPKPPEPKAGTDTVPNTAANLRSEHTSNKYGGGATGKVVDGPRVNSGGATEGMGSAADAAGMANDISNCTGGK
jgi:RHS repeat-associated protein